jgi:putative ABC transport system permease protein
VGDGAVMVEAAFAEALGVGPGDRVALKPIRVQERNGKPSVQARGAGRKFRIVGVAVTAAMAPYPAVACLARCLGDAGLVWLTQPDALSVDPREESRSYVLNLKLAAHPTRRPPFLEPWQDISEASGNLVKNQRRALLTGAWLLAMLAVASVAVLVGGGWPIRSAALDCSRRSAGHRAWSPACCSPSPSSWPSSRPRPGSQSDG